MGDFDDFTEDAETRADEVKRIITTSPLFAPDFGLTPEQIAARKAETDKYLARHDAEFVDMRDGAIRRRLHLGPRISAGDPDGRDD